MGDLDYVLVDNHSGYLKARESVEEGCLYFQKIGGTYIAALVDFSTVTDDRNQLMLSDGSKLAYDFLIASCGPWLKQYFPNLLQSLSISRQEVYYIGVPQREAVLFESTLPCWVDNTTADFYFGIPQVDNPATGGSRGFKIALDPRGTEIDPNLAERLPDPALIEECRAIITHRFPKMKNAPLLASRVCQYSNTTDGNFICDLHPDMANVFILGGGSGHGFKHGPAIGEYISNLLNGTEPFQPAFLLGD